MRRRPSHFVSMLLHAGAVFAMLHLSAMQELPRNGKQTPNTWSNTKLIWHLPKSDSSGGGGGRMTIPASRGVAPKAALRQFLMPTTRRSDHVPLLPVEPTIEGPVQTQAPGLPIGDPTGLAGPPSDGMGGRGGIGNNGGSGGVGDGDGGGLIGGSQAGRITQATLVYKVEPEFTEEARKARVQGVVVLAVVIDEQGRVSHVQVRASLGLGLDERAVEAVQKWRFRPAMQNGKPVRTAAVIEVSFHLL